MSGFCPSTWEPCHRECAPGVCLAHDPSRDGPDPDEFADWRDRTEQEVLRTLLGIPSDGSLPRRASEDDDVAGGSLRA